MDTIFQDPALQSRFDRDGFVIVDFMSADEARALRERALLLLPEKPRINDAQEALYLGNFETDDRRRLIDDFVRRETAGSVLNYLTGFNVFGGTLMVKVPHSGRLAIHQHPPAVADIHQSTINFWCTLDNVDAGRGALRVVPGSHRITRHIATFESPNFFASFAEAVEDRHARTLPMRAGQAVFFDNSLLHGSEANDHDAPLIRVFHALYPVGSKYVILDHLGDHRYDALEMPDCDVGGGVYCGQVEEAPPLVNAGRIDNRQEKLNEAEFAALIASGQKIAPGFDPIDEVRSLMAAAAQPPARFAAWARDAMRKVRERVGA